MSILALVIHILAVVVAANAAAMFRGKLHTRYQEIVLLVCGLVVGVVGLWGALDALFLFEDNAIEISGSILIVVSLGIGLLLGTSFDMEKILDDLAQRIRDRRPAEASGKEKEKTARPASPHTSGKRSLSELPVYNLPSARSGHRYADGFAIATVLLCADPYSILAAARAGTGGSLTLLYYVAIFDFVVIAALALVYGSGTALAAIPMGIETGLIMLFGKWQSSSVAKYAASMEEYTQQLKTLKGDEKTAMQALLDKATAAHTFWSTTFPRILPQMCVIGGILLVLLAVNRVCGKKIKVANMLPALLIPLMYYGVTRLVDVWL